QRGIDFDEAIQITQSLTAFTNHTILAEALEKWPIDELEQVMPEIANIIRELDNRKKDEFPNNHAVSIIDEHDRVHMAHMAIHYGYSINGVAALHTEILKNSELKHSLIFIRINLLTKQTVLRSVV